LGYDATPFNQILKQNAKREMRLRLGKVTVADVLAAQPVTTNLLKFMRASIKMIGVSNLQSFIASMTQKLTLSDISDESKIGRAVQQECRDRSRMPSSACKKKRQYQPLRTSERLRAPSRGNFFALFLRAQPSLLSPPAQVHNPR